jgi:hypothetical protein
MAALNNVSAISGYNNNIQYLNLDDCPPGCVDAINAINTRVNNLTTYINNALEGNIFMNTDGLGIDGLGPMGLHEFGHNQNSTQHTSIESGSTFGFGGKRRKGRKTKKQKKTKKRGNKGKKLTKRNRK